MTTINLRHAVPVRPIAYRGAKRPRTSAELRLASLIALAAGLVSLGLAVGGLIEISDRAPLGPITYPSTAPAPDAWTFQPEWRRTP